MFHGVVLFHEVFHGVFPAFHGVLPPKRLFHAAKAFGKL